MKISNNIVSIKLENYSNSIKNQNNFLDLDQDKKKYFTQIKDVVEISNKHYLDCNNKIKPLKLQEGESVHIIYSEVKNKIIEVMHTQQDGGTTLIKSENWPKELHFINSEEGLDEFLNNIDARSSILDGERKLYINQNEPEREIPKLKRRMTRPLLEPNKDKPLKEISTNSGNGNNELHINKSFIDDNILNKIGIKLNENVYTSKLIKALSKN